MKSILITPPFFLVFLEGLSFYTTPLVLPGKLPVITDLTGPPDLETVEPAMHFLALSRA